MHLFPSNKHWTAAWAVIRGSVWIKVPSSLSPDESAIHFVECSIFNPLLKSTGWSDTAFTSTVIKLPDTHRRGWKCEGGQSAFKVLFHLGVSEIRHIVIWSSFSTGRQSHKPSLADSWDTRPGKQRLPRFHPHLALHCTDLGICDSLLCSFGPKLKSLDIKINKIEYKLPLPRKLLSVEI